MTLPSSPSDPSASEVVIISGVEPVILAALQADLGHRYRLVLAPADVDVLRSEVRRFRPRVVIVGRGDVQRVHAQLHVDDVLVVGVSPGRFDALAVVGSAPPLVLWNPTVDDLLQISTDPRST
jgi:hypothetical protein